MNHIDFIKNKIKQFPELPGIYKMLDSSGNIIYIGKSKCLKKRVQSYFTGSSKWYKVQQMVSMIKDIEHIITDTHLEARLLECEMIKAYNPRFNAQMKNDQRYIYIKVEDYNPYNPLSVSNQRKEHCFGPFRSKFAMEEFFGKLKNIYPITKNENGYECDYHLFPQSMDQEAYEQNREVLLELFTVEDNILKLIHTLQQKLEKAALVYRYETASIYRDLIKDFMYLKYGLDGYKSLSSRQILLKLPIREGYKLFYILEGQIINTKKIPFLTDDLIQDFIHHSEILLASVIPVDKSQKNWQANSFATNEKSLIDFRDILYSEILSLPEEAVEFL